MIDIVLILLFVAGYLLIVFEHALKINKAASALLTGVLCWTVFVIVQHDYHHALHSLHESTGEIAQILFFLLGAMTIVELIDAHNGFDVLTVKIRTSHTVRLMWILGIVTFFLSAVLDNLTTAIVMVSLLRKLIADVKLRYLFAGIVVIAANAGGAWSPIGDVTTTMLWIGGQISASETIVKVFLPSLTCLIVPLVYLSLRLPKTIQLRAGEHSNISHTTLHGDTKAIMLVAGILALIFVPVFKTLTHLPPFMGMMLSLGFMWVLSQIVIRKHPLERKTHLCVEAALRKIDTSSILFFLGILLAISALSASGLLMKGAHLLNQMISNEYAVGIVIGMLSSVVDNVPLVAALMNMYSLEQYPLDHNFWQFLAYCAGTGGSILIIGSAAGVAVMGIEKIDFIWYLKRVALLALLGYLAGAAVYILQAAVL